MLRLFLPTIVSFIFFIRYASGQNMIGNSINFSGTKLRALKTDIRKLSVASSNQPVDQWFTQNLDHFDPFNNNTWQQVIRKMMKNEFH